MHYDKLCNESMTTKPKNTTLKTSRNHCKYIPNPSLNVVQREHSPKVLTTSLTWKNSFEQFSMFPSSLVIDVVGILGSYPMGSMKIVKRLWNVLSIDTLSVMWLVF